MNIKKKTKFPPDIEHTIKILDSLKPTFAYYQSIQQIQNYYQQIALTNTRILENIERWGEASDKYSLYMLQFMEVMIR